MMGFSKDALGKKESNGSGNIDDASSAEIADIKKKMDEQVEEMKELSKATMTIIGKIKKLKADEVSSHVERIDARLEVLEDHMAAVDKNMACVGTCAKNDGLLQQDVGPDKEEAMTLPDLPVKEESHADEKVSNVIETTMYDKMDNDCVSETIKQYENGKPVQGPGKGGIFTKFMSRVLPGKNNGVAPQDSKKVPSEPVSVVPELNKKEMPDDDIDKSLPCAVCEPLETAAAPREDAVDKSGMLEGTVENSAVPVKDVAEHVERPDVDLMAVDKNELRAKMEELIASADQMASERRYSDATEVYVKLTDAYEQNKDNPGIQELGARINELYDKISSNLLNNLMASGEGQNMSAFGESKSI